MGMWGIEAWNNDAAADWFGGVMDVTNLRAHWLDGINSDLEEEYGTVRAAVWLFAQLGRVYVWPIDHFDADLETAIAKGEQLASAEWLAEDVPEFVDKLNIDLSILRSRLK